HGLHGEGQLGGGAPETLIPVSGTVHVSQSGGAVRLSWHGLKPSTARTFYHVLRSDQPNGSLVCAGRRDNAADNCILYADSITTTRATTFLDRPSPGTWTYRIGVAANWLNDPKLGDTYVVTKPAAVTVP